VYSTLLWQAVAVVLETTAVAVVLVDIEQEH
jgi:hypothetical protein